MQGSLTWFLTFCCKNKHECVISKIASPSYSKIIKQNKRDVKNKISRIALKYVFINSISKRNIQIICFLFWICLVVVMFFNRDIYNNFTYGSFEISDWLINYQGGFVRRGVCGEMIHQLYHVHPFDVIMFIKGISAACSILLLTLLLYIFKKEGWSLAILPLPCCLFYNFQMVWVRKDCILLLLVFFVFYTFRRGALSKSIRWFLLSSLFASLAILIHEAFFFYSIPILFVWYSHNLYSKYKRKLLRNVLYSLLPFIPSVVSWPYLYLYRQR